MELYTTFQLRESIGHLTMSMIIDIIFLHTHSPFKLVCQEDSKLS